MKCPKCEHNHKHRDGIACSNCNYVFIFNPKTDVMTDYRMQKQVEKASEQSTVYFTQNQLYASYCGKFKKSYWGYGVTGALVIMGLLIAFADFGVIAIIGIFLFVVIAITIPAKPLSFSNFLEAFDKWHREIKIGKLVDVRLIEGGDLYREPKASKEDDIYNYGVEAIIVTDNDIYVDLFVKNNYHTQYKALIVSKQMYPVYLTTTLKKLLEEKPDLPIFFIHDATKEGAQTMELFKNMEGLATEGHPCIDLGLLPKHFRILKPLKRFARDIKDDEAPLDLLQHRHFVAIFNKYIVERAENQALIDDNEMMEADLANDLSSRMVWIDFVADDFG